MEYVPPEVLERMFSGLPTGDLSCCLGVNCIFRKTSNSNRLWRSAIQRSNPLLHQLIIKEDWIHTLPAIHSSPYKELRFTAPCSYLRCYMEHSQARNNHKSGNFTVTTKELAVADYQSNGLVLARMKYRCSDTVDLYDVWNNCEHLHSVRIPIEGYTIIQVKLKLDSILILSSRANLVMGYMYSITYTTHHVEIQLMYPIQFGQESVSFIDHNSEFLVYHLSCRQYMQVAAFDTGEEILKVPACNNTNIYKNNVIIVCDSSRKVSNVTLTADKTLIYTTYTRDELNHICCWDLTTRSKRFELKVDTPNLRGVVSYLATSSHLCVNNNTTTTISVYNINTGAKLSSIPVDIEVELLMVRENMVVCCSDSSGVLAYSLGGDKVYTIAPEWPHIVKVHRDLLVRLNRNSVEVHGITDGALKYRVPLGLPDVTREYPKSHFNVVHSTDYQFIVKIGHFISTINFKL